MSDAPPPGARYYETEQQQAYTGSVISSAAPSQFARPPAAPQQPAYPPAVQGGARVGFNLPSQVQFGEAEKYPQQPGMQGGNPYAGYAQPQQPAYGGGYPPVGFVIPVQDGFIVPDATPSSARPLRRYKTTKRVQLQNGHLVVDVPVPERYLEKVPIREGVEFTHMRYTAVTCDPDFFIEENFTLRAAQWGRQTEIAICMTMYNEDEVLFARTMHGVMKNIAGLCKRDRSKIWGPDGWKKVVVVIVSDGRKKCDARTLALLSTMGVYQDGVAKNIVNGKEVQGHVFEYSTQISVDPEMTIKGTEKGLVPVQIVFCLKEKNAKKINSHRWFFRAFCRNLQPNVTILLDVGTMPSNNSIYHLWKAFDVDPDVAGACGEISVQKGRVWQHLLNPLVAAQNFEYKISNILDKPLESTFGYISVLPGAFSAYRYQALLEDASGYGPLIAYFKGEHRPDQPRAEGIFESNMYLAEDRILCFELVAKKDSKWVLRYVRSAVGETDVPSEVPELMSQRRRWLNGSFFAAVYAMAHWNRFFQARHGPLRKTAFALEFLYMLFNMLFSWFALASFFLTFYFLGKTVSDTSIDPMGGAGYYIFYILLYIYVILIICAFVSSLGNRPQGSKWMFTLTFVFFAIIMVYTLYASIFLTVKGIQNALAAVPAGANTASVIFQNDVFLAIFVALVGTYGLYFVASFMFFDPWHMVTSFAQYMLIAPSYLNVLNIYAFCNIHDVSWGTKGDNKISTDLGIATTSKKDDGKVEIALPTDQKDINKAYEEDLAELRKPREVKESAPDASTVQEDKNKQFRTNVVLGWILSNGAVIAAISSTQLANLLSPADTKTERNGVSVTNYYVSNKFFAFVLYSVAALAAFRFMGSFIYIVQAIFGRGR